MIEVSPRQVETITLQSSLSLDHRGLAVNDLVKFDLMMVVLYSAHRASGLLVGIRIVQVP